MRQWLLLPKWQGRNHMPSWYILPVRITSSIQLHLRITLPGGLCQSNCPRAIMGYNCVGCCAWIARCRWVRNQQVEKEQAKEVQHTTCTGATQIGCTGGCRTLGIAFRDRKQLSSDLADYSWECFTSLERDAYPASALRCSYTSKQCPSRQHGRLCGRRSSVDIRRR
jgi:hypothetical protein